MPASVHARVAAARERLRRAGLDPDEAELDARLLAEQVLGWTPAQFFAAAADPEPAHFASRFEPLVARRLRREPLAYIIGRQEFWGLPFEVSPAVLVPRPESELIVETALMLFPDRRRPLTLIDACTGSGCLAIAIAHERPLARVVAGDLSAAALAVACRNAARHRVAGRVSLARADLLTAFRGPVDLIVSNPPYVPEPSRATLQPEVRDYEPPEALFAGPDGLDVIRRLIEQAPARLAPGGVLILEFGFGQADAVCELISSERALTIGELRRDLRGIPRTAVARRAGSPPGDL
jgi:release factor glutamine methyltransferase